MGPKPPGSFSSAQNHGRRSTGQQVPLADLWRRAGGRCFVCGHPVALADATREHKLPTVLGGRMVWENLTVSHPPCNVQRGASMRLQLYAQVWARAACCRSDFPRRALLRCHADPAPISIKQIRWAIASAAIAAERRAAHECPARPRRIKDRQIATLRPLLGAVD